PKLPNAAPPQKTPLRQHIQGGLQEGKSITVKGRVLLGAKSFYVNLQCGDGPEANVALHFSARFDKLPGYVVLNSYHQNTWSKECKYESPIPRGSTFALEIMVNRDSYLTSVNGIFFLEYLHQLPPSSVNTIWVDGGIELESVEFPNTSVSPPVRLQTGKSEKTQIFLRNACPVHRVRDSKSHQTKTKGPPYSSRTRGPDPLLLKTDWLCFPCQVTPYKLIMQGGMYHGRSITVQGVVNLSAKTFFIELRYKNGVAFQLSPDFDKSRVVCSSQKWRSEERLQGLPFCKGRPFTVNILCEVTCYRISINGIQTITFKHRYSMLNEIDILEIGGDVSLTSVEC
uniref:Galectin n=1 Tax=Scleropages formosus TaxID=113540 RepID=A0A8C9V829_SCLFO